MKEDQYTDLNTIESYIEDANYSIRKKPITNIYHAVMIWSLFIFIGQITDFLITLYRNHYWLYPSLTYTIIQDGLWIVINIIAATSYFIYLRKKDISLRERHFLAYWSLIVILIALVNIVPLFIGYVNPQFIIDNSSHIPYNWLIYTLGILIICIYRQNKLLLFSVIVNLILIGFVAGILIITYLGNYRYLTTFYFSNIFEIVCSYYLWGLYILAFLIIIYWSGKNISEF